jgi:ABC-2 type transport system ATP-binding protein
MTTAVTLHETTKYFNLPGFAFSSRAALRTPKPYTPAPSQSLAAVDHVSLSICEGEIFGLVGPSGSGKTTLIRLIATLLQPDEGAIRVFGYDTVRQPAQVQRLINRVSVEASFFKQLSPLENLLHGLQPYGPGESDAPGRVVEMLARLGLEQREIHAPMEVLSGDRLQTVGVARALLSRPRLLLLDEPARGLNAQAKREVWQIVHGLRDQHGITVLLTAQDGQELESVCDRVAEMEGGRIFALNNQVNWHQSVNSDCLYPTKSHPSFTRQLSKPLIVEEKVTP